MYSIYIHCQSVTQYEMLLCEYADILIYYIADVNAVYEKQRRYRLF